MTGSKVGQLLKESYHKGSLSGSGSTAGISSTAVPEQDVDPTADNSSSTTAEAADTSQNGTNKSSLPSAEQTLFFNVDAGKQHSKSSSTALSPPLPFHPQQQTTADETQPVVALTNKFKSVKIIAAADSPAAAEPEPKTPFQTASDAGSSRTDRELTNSVSFVSPQLRSMSTSNALLNAASVSAGRGSGLNRKSVAAMSLSPTLGMDGFKIRMGICAMDKKAHSKPMKEIVTRLEGFGEFETVYFGDDLILNRPITDWPKVDCLMSWYSDGFPLAKAQAYADSTHPFLINDLHMQDTLQDRRAVYQVLQDNGIAVPHHIIVNRDGLEPGQEPAGFIEEEDYVELDGVRIDKPFVEKPASGEDHNIHIYYPHSMGGGVKRLFRKIDNKSSCYDPNHPGTVRRDGSYIYEEFLATGGTDVKVYTVGPRYAHAEARKSPVVDGRVLRTPDGKEMRFPVLLSPAEKEISRTVCLAFGQKVCGFDLLRSEKGRSYVCDVNGWSFVKNSRKYYDDAAGILRSTILAALAPHRLTLAPAAANPLSLSSRGLSPMSQQSTASTAAVAAAAAAAAASGAYDEESLGLGLLGKTASLQELSNLMGELSGVDLLDATRTDERSTREELRCVLAVIRHGDRTPKQKLKVRVRQPALLQLFTRHADSKGKQAKLKSPAQLQELLDICRQLLQDLQHPPPSGLSEEELEAREEQKEKLNIVKTVLEQGGQFSGINRKVQLKPLVWSTLSPPAQSPAAAAAAAVVVGDASSEGNCSGAGKQQSGAAAAAEDLKQQQQEKPVIQEVLLILKYGGVLTHAGRAQAEELGKVFRLVMYPRFGSGGGGLLRLHSTYRHDLKIYSSDEGRVQVSAAAFTKGLLALEGSSLTPILVSLVTKDASMLDAFGKGASDDIRRAKQILYTTMTWDPATATANNFTPTWSSTSRATTPAPTPGLLTSPPVSPRAMSRAGSSGGGGVAAAAAAAAGIGVPAASNSSSSKGELEAAVAAVHTGGADPAADGGSSSSTQFITSSPAAAAAAAGGGHAAAAAAGGSNALVMDDIPGMPDSPLQHLKQLNELMKTMVEQLRQLVLAEKRQGVVTTASSSAKDLVQTEAEAAAAAAAAAPEHRSSSSGAGPTSGSTGQQQQLLTSMTNLTSSTSLTDDLPAITNQSAGLRKPPSGLPNSPPRPSTAPPGGAAAAASSGSSSSTGHSVRSSRYSSLSHDPQDWQLQGGQPCSGERLLLMFDRWQKLAKSFYKKGRFDISKVPDIYDSAKYDALHNMHLGLGHTLEELYKEAKILADAVIPNEYGVDPAGKLAIGSKIATELLAKLLDDLRASKEESLATLTDAERSGLGAGPKPGGSSSSTGGSSSSTGDNAKDGTEERLLEKPLGRKSMPLVRTGGSSNRTAAGSSSSRAGPVLGRSTSAAAAAAARAAVQNKDGNSAGNADMNNNTNNDINSNEKAEVTDAGSDHGVGGEAEVEGFEGDEYFFDEEPEMMHRLCPMYASDINSPLRHVRTRIYFTSESHMHSLVNILRLCHLRYQLFGSSSSSSGSFSHGINLTSSSSGVTLGDPYITPRASMDIPAADVAAAAATGRHSSSGGAAAAAAAAPLSPGRSQQPGAAATNGSSSSSSSPPPGPLISDAALDLLKETSELDYLTQLVFRLYENKAVPADHPQRFRIEILFSPGTAYNPITESPAKGDHTLPPQPRVDLHIGEGATLADFDKLLRPFAAKRRQQQQQQQQPQQGKEKDVK